MKRFLWGCQCAWIFIWRCFIVALRARSSKASRRFITKYLNRGGIDILNTMRATYKITYSDPFHLDYSVPVIFMSNHLSLFDLPLIVATIPGHIRVIIKKELTQAPFVGKAALASEQVVVDRNNKAHNKQNFYQDAYNKLKSGILLWAFPEGTRSRSGELLPFKLGVFRLAHEIGAQIVPVGIIGTNHVLPAKKILPRPYQNLEIRIGKPIDTRHLLNTSIENLADQTRQEILSLLNNKI